MYRFVKQDFSLQEAILILLVFSSCSLILFFTITLYWRISNAKRLTHLWLPEPFCYTCPHVLKHSMARNFTTIQLFHPGILLEFFGECKLVLTNTIVHLANLLLHNSLNFRDFSKPHRVTEVVHHYFFPCPCSLFVYITASATILVW